MLDIPINGDSIKLGQFIKLASLVATGGEAKELIVEGVVTVNGDPETRRGAMLHPGDEVCIEGACARVGEPDDADYFDESTADDDFDPEKWRNL
ncbi:RNA-binding protein [Corynebacterium macginleyi]|uniref:RNA-binding S4 domain-containing protein n=1 Tax=Corynebacterium macginleyi TaxID=38290 RepID=UPI00190A7D61|nr:RNA-binding S4 domain-containing protein [Corynebacterium macginleyi]MBK4152466.1 RNA-binding protein [Corynebacterium macginleyi]